MSINKQKIGAMVVVGIIFSVPLLVSAAGLVPCGASGEPECDFSQLIKMANNIIQFLLYSVAVPLAALGFMWVGANLIINQNKEGAWSTAKESFWYIAQGFAIMIGAYLLIKLILFQFLSDEQAKFMEFIIK